MEVTHVQDHVTHAVISGAQAIDFGISDSAEFFNILSTTLYSDQQLAVIRETLCNEWDAHIEAGITDRAVEITLDQKFFTIRDFGHGIPKRLIGPIYGTYGGSTKVANGAVTGGFGLGCKAPFADVDDFEVTSFCENEKTIYRLSKSNAEVGGKPSIIPVVTVPTTETGLQVKIGIKNEQHRARYEELIKRIVQNGAMKVTLNGELLDTLPFDDMQHGFMLTKAKVLENHKPIVIRYGNVIYPIDNDEAYNSEWNQITEFLQRMTTGNRWGSHNNNTWTLVLQAAPNTVSVTPSRESLSLQKHTQATIKQLMNGFLETKDKKLSIECFKLLEDRINKTWMDATPAILFDTEHRMPNLYRPIRMSDGRQHELSSSSFIFEIKNNLTTFPEFVQQYSHSAYPEFKDFRKRDIVTRINTLLESGFNGKPGRKMLKSYRRAYLQSLHQKQKINRQSQLASISWFQQHVVWPLGKKMNEENGLKLSKLFAYTNLGPYRHDREKVRQATTIKAVNMEQLLPFLRNIVILSFNKMDVVDGNADQFGISKYWLGNTVNSLVYVVPRAEAKVQQARDFFLAAGVNLIDLTIEQQSNYDATKRATAAAPVTEIIKKPKKTGIPMLTSMVDGTGYYNTQWATASDIERTTTPKFVIKDGRRLEFNYFEEMSREDTKLIIDVYGKDGAVCVNQNQYDRYITAGAIDYKVYILNNLVEEYETNPRIREYLRYDTSRIDVYQYRSQYYPISQWIKVIVKDKDLSDYFGLVDNRTDEDKKLMRIYDASERWDYGRAAQHQEIQKIIKLQKLEPVVEDLFKTLQSSKLLRIMDADECDNAINSPTANLMTDKQSNLARDLLLQAIEG